LVDKLFKRPMVVDSFWRSSDIHRYVNNNSSAATPAALRNSSCDPIFSAVN
jgi:hypothetical protein